MDPEGFFHVVRVEIQFCKILRCMASNISYNTLQFHQTAQSLVIVDGDLNQLSIDTNILGFCLE